MIHGEVNADLEAIVPLLIRDAAGQVHQIEAIVDTGFSGFLTLSPALVAAMGLPWLCEDEGVLADGSAVAFNVHRARVMWDGQPREIDTEAVDVQSLIDMAMLEGHQAAIEVKIGGNVTIQAIPYLEVTSE